MTASFVEIEEGEVRWPGPDGTVRVVVPDLADAGLDPASDVVVALSRAGRGRLHLFARDGAALAAIDPPIGYTLSYLVKGSDGLRVVAAGETPFEGWHDWHFAVDAAGGRLTRAGPAY